MPNNFITTTFSEGLGNKSEKEYERCYKINLKAHSEFFPVWLYLHLKIEDEVLKIGEHF